MDAIEIERGVDGTDAARGWTSDESQLDADVDPIPPTFFHV